MQRRQPELAEPPRHAGDNVISTGSTLLDLAISGGVYEEGGLPGGILVEIFGPSSTGKTVLLSEIAGGVQRRKGGIKFFDPEGRMNKQFARMFGLEMDEIEYEQANTVSEVFSPLIDWEPDGKGPHGVFADSLAALSTELELEDSDKMGMRRAKEFSEQLRKVCRLIAQRNILMVCSNQVRQNLDAGKYGQKWITPGGQAIGFYSSVRLRTSLKEKIKRERKVRGCEHTIVTGVEIEIEVFKNSVWSPYRKAPVIIGYDYGIDDVKANLQYVKDHTGSKVYQIGDTKLSASLENSAEDAESDGLVAKLKEETIGIWKEVEAAFASSRRKRHHEEDPE